MANLEKGFKSAMAKSDIKPLSKTNPYAKDKKKWKEMMLINAKSSCAIEK